MPSSFVLDLPSSQFHIRDKLNVGPPDKTENIWEELGGWGRGHRLEHNGPFLLRSYVTAGHEISVPKTENKIK